MKQEERGFRKARQVPSLPSCIANSPALCLLLCFGFFPPYVTKSVVAALLSHRVSQQQLHKFKLACFAHKSMKLEDQEKQFRRCIFHVLNGG